ncbi:hypothetical protein, partial [Candidatus Binatus sp.]|uniref:hypothetical protein n=1 Tax=Candidatus Binatus sp. TaxID=2811406 RepID=UPI003C754000
MARIAGPDSIAMHFRFKTSLLLGCIAVVFAIALAIGSAPGLAQSPATGSHGALSAAPANSAVATA